MMIDPYRIVCTGRLFPEQAKRKSHTLLCFLKLSKFVQVVNMSSEHTLCPFRIGYLECCVSVNSAYTLEGTALGTYPQRKSNFLLIHKKLNNSCLSC